MTIDKKNRDYNSGSFKRLTNAQREDALNHLEETVNKIIEDKLKQDYKEPKEVSQTKSKKKKLIVPIVWHGLKL